MPSRFALLSFVAASLGAMSAFLIHPKNCERGCTSLDPALVKKFEKEVNKDALAFGPFSVCYAPGTDPAIVAAHQQAMQNANDGAWPDPHDRYQLSTRWSGAQGSPRTLTWSFVPDGTSIPGSGTQTAMGSTLFASMDAKFGGNRATWVAQFQSVFNRWSALTGITYVRVQVGGNDWDDGAAWGTASGAGLRGDVRIASRTIDGPSNVLAYNYYPSNGDMVLDSEDNWGSSTNTYRFLRNTIAHEHGHGIGLAHVCPIGNNKLMEPYLNTGFNGPQQDDIRAGNRHYGDPYEPDNSTATASVVGAIGVGSSLSVGTISEAPNATNLSIDADGEQDYFKFTVTAPVVLRATATPVGTTYLNNPQTSACDVGTNDDALRQADLAVDIVNSAGTTIATDADGGLGVAEQASIVVSPGDYYVRVYESNAPAESQLYRLNVVGEAVPNTQISGHIDFLEWTNPNAALPLTITVRNANTNAVIASVNTTTSAAGNYSVSVPSLPTGTTYKFQAEGVVWLRKSQNALVNSSTLTNLNFALFNGDADGSGEVDLTDIDVVIAAYGQATSNPAQGDLDGSGEVDLNDIDIAISNYGRGDD